jgi:outer membrane protein assembly factor BamB
MRSKRDSFALVTSWALFAGLLAGCADGSAVNPATPSNSFATLASPLATPSAAEHTKIVNWPQVGFDSGHSGYNPKEKTLSPSNVAGLTMLWSTSTGSGNTTYGLVSEGGVLYGMSYNELYALKPSTGAPIWTSAAYAGNGGSAPAVAGNLVLADCGTSIGDELCAYTRKDGKPVWSAGCQCDLFNPPTVDGAHIYAEFAYGGTTWDALDAKSGSVAWNYAVGNHCANGGGDADPVANGTAYYTVGCQGSNSHTSLCAFDAQNGIPGWCTQLATGGCDAVSTDGVTAANNVLFANLQAGGSCSDQLVAFNAKTGVREWSVNISGNNPLHAQPAVAVGVVYEYTNSGVQAFSAKNGRLLWTQSSADSYGGVDISVANGVVYAGCYHNDGELCALNAKNGKLLWSSGILGGGNTTPIVVDGVLYGSCGGSDFCAFGLPRHRR